MASKPDVKKDGTPIHRCGATINGPKVGRHVVLYRKQCRIIVKNEDNRCRFHQR